MAGMTDASTRHYDNAVRKFFSLSELSHLHTLKVIDRPHLSFRFDADGQSIVPSEQHFTDEDDDGTDKANKLSQYDLPMWRSCGLGSDLSFAPFAVAVPPALPLLLSPPPPPSAKWLALKAMLSVPPLPSESPVTVDVSSIPDQNVVGASPPFYEVENIPCTIKNVTADWKGDWTFKTLASKFRSTSFRFSDTHGEMLEMELYERYCRHLAIYDDSPLAIYDSQFGEAYDDGDDDDGDGDEASQQQQQQQHSPLSQLLGQYSVPSCFSKCMFGLVHPRYDSIGGGRPPYRWVLVGPERSGTGLHIDPLRTNAWVTLLEGRKRWLLFPHGTPLSSMGLEEGAIVPSSSVWFAERYAAVLENWDEGTTQRPIEVLQEPGDTVFVPMGWMHVVLNLEASVAVTQNYASEFYGLREIWKDVCTHEKGFAKRLYKSLREEGSSREDLAKKIWDVHNAGFLEGEENWKEGVELGDWDDCGACVDSDTDSESEEDSSSEYSLDSVEEHMIFLNGAE